MIFACTLHLCSLFWYKRRQCTDDCPARLQKQVNIDCLIFRVCPNGHQSSCLMCVPWVSDVSLCYLKNAALYCRQKFCSRSIGLPLTAESCTFSGLQWFLCFGLWWVITAGCELSKRFQYIVRHYSSAPSSAQSKLLLVPLFLHHS